MEIIEEFLNAEDCEKFFHILETLLQCQELERRLAAQQQHMSEMMDPTATAQKHMTLLMHSQLCRTNRNFQAENCNVRHCKSIKNILSHALRCRIEGCPVGYCRTARRLTIHYEACCESTCPICTFAYKANGFEQRPRPIFYQQKPSVPTNKHHHEHLPCGQIEYNYNPFTVENPPNKIGPKARRKDDKSSKYSRNPKIKEIMPPPKQP